MYSQFPDITLGKHTRSPPLIWSGALPLPPPSLIHNPHTIWAGNCPHCGKSWCRGFTAVSALNTLPTSLSPCLPQLRVSLFFPLITMVLWCPIFQKLICTISNQLSLFIQIYIKYSIKS